MEQFSGGGPPNPRFLPKLSMTVQVNHKSGMGTNFIRAVPKIERSVNGVKSMLTNKFCIFKLLFNVKLNLFTQYRS